MASRSPRTYIGQIRHVPVGQHRGAEGAWWVVTQTRPHVFGAYLVAPTGRNIGRYEHLGQITGVDQCDVVPEDQVPDEIQALAMSHLLLKGLNNGPA